MIYASEENQDTIQREMCTSQRSRDNEKNAWNEVFKSRTIITYIKFNQMFYYYVNAFNFLVYLLCL
jgi:hypothetical protein